MTQSLAEYFQGAAAKELTLVDCISPASNQHEVTGSKVLIGLLDSRLRKKTGATGDERFVATYLYLSEDDNLLSAEGYLSWYDTRENKPHRSAEWRLYYQKNEITKRMKPGDRLFVLRRNQDRLVFFVCHQENDVLAALEFVFGITSEQTDSFSSRQLEPGTAASIGYLGLEILDLLGIPFRSTGEFDPAAIVAGFKGKFPDTRTFSELARNTLPEIDPRDDPDFALMSWIDREELLFRELEREIVAKRIREGFYTGDGKIDVDGFLGFSLSAHNRRKSRAGYALMNHFSKILDAHEITYDAEATTEKKHAADFLFPGEDAYRDAHFPAEKLNMLATKTTCKDRWRQVLAEADRIQRKHLLTLQPGISVGQTNEMLEKGLHLVIPMPIQPSYRPEQVGNLLSLRDFVSLVR
ncbi:type II restriction endonuclease [Hyphobacterium marinum]|uniref:Type II restriction endonuclease n=1 Tax=Hyphobacterium marinum TaxID=3116574 RepID=A0ABU7LV86_9PROT|nr:type II restriction endonuclease [Hyphobacterium sp. Y6023]MEE2565463.1 type II restriction endonuclease [Hyphobacterium sp. Y6023]